ncbi:MAG: S8 family serine peptidase [Oceanococcaceae bacterium]
MMQTPPLLRGAAALVLAFVMLPASLAHAAQPPGLTQLTQLARTLDSTTNALLGIVMLDAVPDAEHTQALRDAGLDVQPMRHLPMALARGPLATLQAVVRDGLASDVYPNSPLRYLSAESTAVIGADVTRASGIDGRGVGVAIVDSGIDGTHADLANNVVRNVRVYGPEYLSVLGLEGLTGPLPPQPSIVIPFDNTPYNNTDTVGHGTHVAGITGADGAGNPDLIGVAPAVDLIGYSTGEILFIFTAVASFDDILATQDEFNIRVVNNSWGSAYRTFDPNDPINVATKALHDAGITVVYAAGNNSTEMSTNPYAMAPWVISAAATDVQKVRAGFSSAGLMYDNSEVAELDDNGHVRFTGNRLGLSYPHVAAPGAAIDAPGTPTGITTTTGTPPNGSASLSGTSMAAPHVAGLAALLLQARPELTPAQVRKVMEVTAVPMADESALWQVGFGFIDAAGAVAYVQDPAFSNDRLEADHAAASAALLAARPFTVVAGDLWSYQPLPVSVAGLDSVDLPFTVEEGVDAIRASVSFPGDLGIAGINALFNWTATLIDPTGAEVATSETLSLAAVGVLQADFPEQAMPGEWTLALSGIVQLTQPALLFGGSVNAAAVQLRAQEPVIAPGRQGATGAQAGGSMGPLLLIVLLIGARRLRRRGA